MTVCFPVIAICNVEALLAPMPGISDAVTGTRLNDHVSEVDVTKYQQAFLESLLEKAYVNCVGKVMNKRKMDIHLLNRLTWLVFFFVVMKTG